MIFARSVIFYIFLVIWTITWPFLLLPFAFFYSRVALFVQDVWNNGVIIALRLICGVRVRCIGKEQLPSPPFMIACKHQSTLETLFLNTIFPNPIFVLKQELLYIPVFGRYMRMLGMAHIDRNSGVTAMRQMGEIFGQAFACGRIGVIFPEGTRSLPGQKVRYKPGIAFIHAANPEVPIVPVALNSGLFWPRSGFPIHPGEVVVQFLPAITNQLDRQELLDTLHDTIETACQKLLP